MSNNELFQKIKELLLPAGKFALFGSAPLAIRDIRESNDVDVIITGDVWEEYQGRDGWIEKQAPHGDISLCNGGIELWKDWHPGEWNINQMIREAEMIDGLPFVTLDRVIEWKKMKGREKDLQDLILIEDFLSRQASLEQSEKK